jgi:hypothetical protein
MIYFIKVSNENRKEVVISMEQKHKALHRIGKGKGKVL